MRGIFLIQQSLTIKSLSKCGRKYGYFRSYKVKFYWKKDWSWKGERGFFALVCPCNWIIPEITGTMQPIFIKTMWCKNKLCKIKIFQPRKLLSVYGRWFHLFKSGLFVAAIALVFNALADSGLIYMLKPLLDDGFGKADHSFLKLMAFVVVGMIMLRGVTNFISSYCLAWVSGKVVMIMRRRLFKHWCLCR